MIVWGGGTEEDGHAVYLSDGGRYDPTTDVWRNISDEGAPHPRAYHTAVWTGKGMIVWGGSFVRDRRAAFLNDGARYNPATDSWLPVSPSPLAPRSGHSAVWTGKEMIIWGGFQSQGVRTTQFSDGARYDPAADSWAIMNDDGAPNGRFWHSAVWTGAEMIVWGGVRAEEDGARYRPDTDEWLPMSTDGGPPSANPRSTVWTGTEMLVWGGYGGTNPHNQGAAYDPRTDSWRTFSQEGGPSRRWHHTGVWTGAELMIWGGRGPSGGPSRPSAHPTEGGRYDPANDTWASIVPPFDELARIVRHTAVWTGSELLIWGGSFGEGYGNHGFRYSPECDEDTASSQ